jgi:hypothetical protein
MGCHAVLEVYFSALNMAAADPSETSVIIWQITWRHIP